MIKQRPRPLALFLTVGILVGVASASSASESWRGFRGGPDAPTGVIPDSFGLTVDWNRELGSGYSSVSLQDGLLVTMFTEGDEDVLAAFDAETGEEQWRLRLAEKYAGHNGSDDGPLSVPTLDGDRVFAFGPRGQLVAADLQTGREVWRVELDESNSSVPFYGYTCSPLVVDDLVVLLVGGEGRAVVAYSRETGEERWAAGTDTVTYQSPILAELGGRRQIVAVTDQWARGLDPKSGEELWNHRIQTGEAREDSSHPTVLDSDHLLIDLDDESVALRVVPSGNRFEVTEAWRSRAFGSSFVLPVVHEGVIYGFTGRILTAASTSTGEILWRSRAAQGPNLTLVDGHLAVVTFDGELVVAEANPEGYVEKARLEVFENADFQSPAYADGHLFVRNLTHLAAVKIDTGVRPEVAAVEVDEFRHLGTFGTFVRDLEQLPESERQARVDSYFSAVRHVPLVERDGSAHIVYRGEATDSEVTDVAVHGTLLGWEGAEREMHRVAGTDLFYRSFQLDPAGVYGYQLAVEFGNPAPDAANPNEIDGFIHASELRLPSAKVNLHLAEPDEDTPRGSLNTFRFHSQSLENYRDIQVWTPPGFGGDETYPLLVVNYGNLAVSGGHMNNVLDNLVGNRVAPVVVAFVPRIGGGEYNGEQAPDYAKFLAEELVPYFDRHYQTGGSRAIMGPASAGVISLHTALAFPGIFDKVVTQSFYLTDANREEYQQRLKTSKARPRVWVETGPNDYQIPSAGIFAQRSSEALIETLEAEGFEVEALTTHGNASWAGWRLHTDQILEALFPADS